MLTNDMKKGTRVRLRGTGWYATLVDNKKGNVRMADVEGLYRETGSIYAHDIVCAVIDGREILAEYTPAQLKLSRALQAMAYRI